MGIDGMRVAGGRCPPLLVGGLLVACLILTCNWWTLSSENLELLRQIDELSEQLKTSYKERDQCAILRENLKQKYKQVEDESAVLHVRLAEETDVRNKNIESLEDSLTMCKTELDSLKKLYTSLNVTLTTLRLKKDNLDTQLDEKRKDNEKLQNELKKTKDELKKVKEAEKTTQVKQQSVQVEHVQTTISTSKNGTSLDTEDNKEALNDAKEQFESIGDEAENQVEFENLDQNNAIESDRDQQMKAIPDSLLTDT